MTARIFTEKPLAANDTLTLEGNPAHYLSRVMRLGVGDAVHLFNGRDGEWLATLADIKKHAVMLKVTTLHAPQRNSPAMTLCFAPPAGRSD